MNNDIRSPSDIVNDFIDGGGQDNIELHGTWRWTITRHDGSEEEIVIKNIMNYVGLNQVAAMLTSNAQSAFLYIAIGTVTAQPSLESNNFGEVANGRKLASLAASSHEVGILVATWAGAADSLTGIPLGSGAAVNHASSGEGQILNIVNSVSATLQDSDFLKVQVDVQCGSHNLP